MGIYTNYLGRVGDICDRVLTIQNDMKTNAHFNSDTDMLLWINDCQGEIAQDGYWVGSASFNTVAGQESYDLYDITSDDIVYVHNLYLTQSNNEFYLVPNWKRWAEIKKDPPDSGPFVLVHNQQIKITPTPTTSTTDYGTIYYTYCPPPLGGGNEITVRSAAVVNMSNGLVSIPVTGSTLVYGDEVVIDGTTNYDGTYLVQQGSSSTGIIIEAEYHAETLSISDVVGRYYTPKIPPVRDDVFVNFCLAQSCLKDMGRRAQLYKIFDEKYRQAKAQLLNRGLHLRRTLEPVR